MTQLIFDITNLTKNVIYIISIISSTKLKRLNPTFFRQQSPLTRILQRDLCISISVVCRMSNGRKKIIPRRTIKPADVRASDWTTDQIRKQTAIMKIERGTAAKPARQTVEFCNDFDIEIGRVLTFLFSVFWPSSFFRAYRTAESWRTIDSTHLPSEFSFGIFFTKTFANPYAGSIFIIISVMSRDQSS